MEMRKHNRYTSRNIAILAEPIEKVSDSISSAFPNHPWWRAHLPSIVLGVISALGVLIATEQYLSSQYEESQSRAEQKFLAASAALGSNNTAIQLSGIRIISKLSEFSTYESPSAKRHLFHHMLSQIRGPNVILPYADQSWLLLKDIASAPRSQNDAIISTVLLEEGMALENRLNNSRLRGSLFYNTNLPGVKALNIKFPSYRFGKANLMNSKLDRINCNNCNFTGSNLTRSEIGNSNFQSTFMVGAALTGAKISHSDLSNSTLKRAKAQRVYFRDSDLSSTNFEDANLDGSIYDQTILLKTNFTNSSLRKARFYQVDVSQANFTNADIYGADFRYTTGFSQGLIRNALNREKAILPNTVNPTPPLKSS